MLERRVQSAAEFGRVALAMGGHAAEREISLKSGAAVLQALRAVGIQVDAIDTAQVGLDVFQGFDRVFNIVHGRGGEDGSLQGALDYMGVPYTGSGVMGSVIGMDKHMTKRLWLADNIPTPQSAMMTHPKQAQELMDYLGPKVVVKPAREGSSIGMALAHNAAELTAAWVSASQYDDAILIEQFVSGKEYTAAYVAGQSLPLIQLQTPNEFYDYEAKYQSNSTEYLCPCGLPNAVEEQLQALMTKAFTSVQATGWGRVDFMLDSQQQPWCLEINTVPGMTDHSLVPMAAREFGWDMQELVWRVLETSVPMTGDVHE